MKSMNQYLNYVEIGWCQEDYTPVVIIVLKNITHTNSKEIQCKEIPIQ